LEKDMLELAGLDEGEWPNVFVDFAIADWLANLSAYAHALLSFIDMSLLPDDTVDKAYTSRYFGAIDCLPTSAVDV
jgi:hypothetical protein